MSEFKENSIEWITGDDKITFTLSQKKYINKVKNIERKHKNEVDFVENDDGSIFGHRPLKALKLSIISTEKRDFSNAFGRSKEAEDND